MRSLAICWCIWTKNTCSTDWWPFNLAITADGARQWRMTPGVMGGQIGRVGVYAIQSTRGHDNAIPLPSSVWQQEEAPERVGEEADDEGGGRGSDVKERYDRKRSPVLCGWENAIKSCRLASMACWAGSWSHSQSHRGRL